MQEINDINDAQGEDNTFDVETLINRCDLALSPRYSMKQVNEPLQLYSGPLHISFGDGIDIPRCDVRWEWRREPMMLAVYRPTECQMMTGNASDILCKRHQVTLAAINARALAVEWEGHSCGSFHEVTLRLLGRAVVGELQPVHRAICHLVNCPDLSERPVRTGGGGWRAAGRLHLESEHWTIDIDAVPKCTELITQLNAFGGQAITHVFSVERRDRRAFSVDELQDLVVRLQHFLAFTVGQRPKLCFPSGYDASGNQLWELWVECGHSNWNPTANWRMEHFGGHVGDLFPGFMTTFEDGRWAEPCEITIDWYVQAKNRGVETALVLGQAALDLLANTLFESQGKGDAAAFDSKSAPKKLRWLLQQLRIPNGIPPKLTKLSEFRFQDGTSFEDAPKALVELRNAITHPTRSNRSKFGESVDGLRGEAAEMVLFFLEHSLLRLFGFRGLASAESTYGCCIDYRGATDRRPST